MKIFLLLLLSNLVFGVTGNRVWRIPSGGTLGAWGPVNLADSTNAVTGLLPNANIAAVSSQVSSSSASFSTTSTSYVDVTNMTVTITSVGKPVVIMFQPDGAGVAASQWIDNSNTPSPTFKLLRGATNIGEINFSGAINAGGAAPTGSLNFLDIVGAGTYTYKIQAKVANNTTTLTFTNFKMVAYELK